MSRLQITAGDIELFRWLWMLRILTIDQCRRLRYYQPQTGRLSSEDNVRKRLARLAKAGYLVRGDLLDEERLRPMRVYFLGEQALEPLRFRYGITQRRLYRFDVTSLRYAHHALWVSEFAVRLVECLRDSRASLPQLKPLGAPMYTSHIVENPRKKRHVERYVTQEDVRVPGFAARFRVRPDLVFALDVDGAQRLYFLEADRGTEGRAQIEEKLTAYHHYAETHRWRRYSSAGDFRVLVVTTTQRRVESFLEAFVEHPARGRLAMATFTAIKGKDLVQEPVWRTGRSQPARLVMGGLRIEKVADP